MRQPWLLLLALWVCFAGLAASASAEPIVPTPPEFVQDRQLPGEDPYDIAKPVFSPDAAYVAAFFHTSKVLTVWDVKSGQVVAEIPDSVHGYDACDGLEFTPDGKQLIVMRNFLPLKYIDWKTKTVTRSVELNADPKKILSYAFSPDMTLLAVGTYTGIQLWDLKAGKKVKDYLSGQAISGLDMLIYKDKKGKVVRLLAYGRAVLPPDLSWKNVAGLLDLDTGKHTPLLNDIPADKKVEGNMTFFFTDFEWGGGHVLVTYSSFPPKVKAGVYLIDTWTGKYVANQQLGQPVVKFRTPRYLWKPFYGFVLTTADMSNPTDPYKVATQFLVPTKDKGLVILDTIDEKTLPAFGMRIGINYHHAISKDPNWWWAAVALKKDATDTCKLYLYKLVPKKK